MNTLLKPLGPWLGVNWTWTKRSDHAPKHGCVVCSGKTLMWKRAILEIIFMFDFLPFIFTSFLITIKMFGQKRKKKKRKKEKKKRNNNFLDIVP
jgi:hypothetical protein